MLKRDLFTLNIGFSVANLKRGSLQALLRMRLQDDVVTTCAQGYQFRHSYFQGMLHACVLKEGISDL